MGYVHHDSPRSWRSPGLLIGLGLGGFADGILLHQVLQWHNMLSAISPPSTVEAMQLNMRWDGLFHVVTWMLTLAGVVQLWRAGARGCLPRSGLHLTGQVVLGWGLFNLIEGLLDHQLLGIHHVREGPAWLAYDVAFLALGGVGLLLLGLLLGRRPRDRRGAPV
jgi:uncharacterized membrane protein